MSEGQKSAADKGGFVKRGREVKGGGGEWLREEGVREEEEGERGEGGGYE